jgi:hypothetical protein
LKASESYEKPYTICKDTGLGKEPVSMQWMDELYIYGKTDHNQIGSGFKEEVYVKALVSEGE